MRSTIKDCCNVRIKQSTYKETKPFKYECHYQLNLSNICLKTFLVFFSLVLSIKLEKQTLIFSDGFLQTVIITAHFLHNCAMWGQNQTKIHLVIVNRGKFMSCDNDGWKIPDKKEDSEHHLISFQLKEWKFTT